MSQSVKGLEISRGFYESCRPFLEDSLADILPKAAIGLAGEGSECFGMDDAFSRDHDFNAGFCVWLSRSDIITHGDRIKAALGELPVEFAGLPTMMAGVSPRRGLICTEIFYSFLTGLAHPPKNWREWLNMKEEGLAAACNGEIFKSGDNEFRSWRDTLLAFYPEDVRLKKLAARCMIMAQTGQYNLPRAIQRNDGPDAMLILGRFCEAAISFVFLINRRYKPYYKWAAAIGATLPIAGRELAALLKKIAATPAGDAASLIAPIEAFCGQCASYLRGAGLSDVHDSWLWAHGPQITARVQEPELRAMNLLEG